MSGTHILHLYRPRVSYFLSHGIVKSLTFKIYGKLKFQCTRNGPRTLRFVQGLSRTPLSFFPRYLTTRFSKHILLHIKFSKIKKSAQQIDYATHPTPPQCRPPASLSPPHPTPPQMAFSEVYWAFPFTGHSQVLGVPMAWQRRRQAMAKWRWGRRKWRWVRARGAVTHVTPLSF